MMPLYGCHPRTLPFSGFRQLAAAVVLDAVETLRRVPRCGESKHYRDRDIAFFRDATRSARWCEMAGFDWAAIVSKLDQQGLLATDVKVVPQLGIGRIETTLPRRIQAAMTVREVAKRLNVSRTYVVRCLATLESKGRVYRAGTTTNPQRAGNRPATLWYRKAA